MEQIEIIATIDKLMVVSACKILEYSQCTDNSDRPEIRKNILLQLKGVANEITELKQRLNNEMINQLT